MGGVLEVERDGGWLETKWSYCSALLFSPFHLITSSGPQLFWKSYFKLNFCLGKVDILFEGIDHAMPGEEGVSQPK